MLKKVKKELLARMNTAARASGQRSGGMEEDTSHSSARHGDADAGEDKNARAASAARGDGPLPPDGTDLQQENPPLQPDNDSLPPEQPEQTEQTAQTAHRRTPERDSAFHINNASEDFRQNRPQLPVMEERRTGTAPTSAPTGGTACGTIHGARQDRRREGDAPLSVPTHGQMDDFDEELWGPLMQIPDISEFLAEEDHGGPPADEQTEERGKQTGEQDAGQEENQSGKQHGEQAGKQPGEQPGKEEASRTLYRDNRPERDGLTQEKRSRTERSNPAAERGHAERNNYAVRRSRPVRDDNRADQRSRNVRSDYRTSGVRQGSGRSQRDRLAREKKRRRMSLLTGLLLGFIGACLVLSVVVAVILIRRPETETAEEAVLSWVESVAAPLTGDTQEEEESAEEPDALEEDTQSGGIVYTGVFELPLEGTTGYASTTLSVTDESGSRIASLDPGEAFVILSLDGEYFEIEMKDGTVGQVQTAYSWVNLPDLIPSIVYYDVNSVASMFRSSGYELPGITGEVLYNSIYQNDRLGEEQFCMPVLYTMALKIMNIQQACLAEGESLKIYQTFRPYETQMDVADALQELEGSNSDVKSALNEGSWSDTWFIAMKLSNHQRGCAIDVSLVQVDATEERTCGGYLYTVVTDYTEYEMPCDMHELSPQAAVYDPPVSSSNDTEWRTASYATTMTGMAYRLQNYCTEYGLSPLSSEWWHFNDLEARSESSSNAGSGRFYLEECLSREPDTAS